MEPPGRRFISTAGYSILHFGIFRNDRGTGRFPDRARLQFDRDKDCPASLNPSGTTEKIS
jgi:hypothetical protein